MDYFKEVNLAVTICDKEGKILEMNDKSRKTFLKPGQEDLIGKNLWGLWSCRWKYLSR